MPWKYNFILCRTVLGENLLRENPLTAVLRHEHNYAAPGYSSSLTLDSNFKLLYDSLRDAKVP